MKLIQTILLGIFLTALVHVQTSNSFSIGDLFTTQWKEYIRSLETWLDVTEDLLPFLFSFSVVRDLEHSTPELTDFLMETETKLSKTHGAISPVTALEKALDVIYDDLLKRTKKNGDKLKKIRMIDPLGFEAYLNIKNKRDEHELDIDDCVDEYMETMLYRVLLYTCRHNASSIKDPELNANGKLSSIPEAIRKEITTEYAPITEATINYFLNIAAKQYPNTRIYRVRENTVHASKGTDGLRILSASRIGPQKEHNWICIRYNSYTKRLHVYDNDITKSILKYDVPIQENIFNKMFPYKVEPIVYDKSKTCEADPASNGIYAIIYAATALNGEDPAKIKFHTNDMYGDPTLYMRLHILKMFANNRVSSM